MILAEQIAVVAQEISIVRRIQFELQPPFGAMKALDPDRDERPRAGDATAIARQRCRGRLNRATRADERRKTTERHRKPGRSGGIAGSHAHSWCTMRSPARGRHVLPSSRAAPRPNCS